MRNKINKRNVTFLHPGNAIITNKSRVIYTVLGSCIAVTMHVPRLKIGAIAHCLLPAPGLSENCECSDCTYKFKYISCTIPLMLESLQRYRINLDEIEIKIFGGANLIASNGSKRTSKSIGSQNADLATRIIEETNLKIKSLDTGGSVGRKIYFFTESGEVYLKRIKRTEIENTKDVLIS